MKHERFNESKVNWRKTIEDIHDTAKDSGFWDMMEMVLEKMERLNKDHLKDYFDEEEILQVKKAFIMQKIMLIVSELGESVESDRKSKYADWDDYGALYKELIRDAGRQEFAFTSAFEGYIKDSFEDELADTIIRIFDLCEKFNIPIIKHIAYKMEYNKTRSKLHGKEY